LKRKVRVEAYLNVHEMTYNLLWGVPTNYGVLVKGSVKVRKSKDDGAKKLVTNLMEGERKH